MPYGRLFFILAHLRKQTLYFFIRTLTRHHTGVNLYITSSMVQLMTACVV
jgi:hypothetical protein